MTVSNFNTPLSPKGISSRQQLNRTMQELNNFINLMDLANIYRIFTFTQERVRHPPRCLQNITNFPLDEPPPNKYNKKQIAYLCNLPIRAEGAGRSCPALKIKTIISFFRHSAYLHICRCRQIIAPI